MHPPLILLERTSRWATALRREMRRERSRAASSAPLELHEVRSVAQCQRELDASPHAVVAMEVLPHNLAAMTKALGDWSHQFPHARFIALAARGLEPHELVLREAGAIHLTYSPRSLTPLLRLIHRHLARAPRPELTLEKSIEAGLPWG